MRKLILMLTAAVGLALAFHMTAIAQQKAGPNGGLIAGKDGHETELVVAATELTVFLLEDGKAQTTKGSTIKAVVQQAGKATNIELKDVENKKLVGQLASPLAKGAIVVLTGKDHHGHAITARYVLN